MAGDWSTRMEAIVAGHPSMDLDPKTQNSILKQAELK
jgi:predicted RNA binding protein YcfA (HicA-like mRNA interferase family)